MAAFHCGETTGCWFHAIASVVKVAWKLFVVFLVCGCGLVVLLSLSLLMDVSLLFLCCPRRSLGNRACVLARKLEPSVKGRVGKSFPRPFKAYVSVVGCFIVAVWLSCGSRGESVLCVLTCFGQAGFMHNIQDCTVLLFVAFRCG